ncbi:MAG: hypothetical protein ACPGRX_05045 [Bdellovibrionales bacterium]
MSLDFQKGLSKIGEAQSAVICQQVTEAAQRAKMQAEAERERGAGV